ncbi:hypothetical protein GCM10009605_18110 [Nocardiopsis composta]
MVEVGDEAQVGRALAAFDIADMSLADPDLFGQARLGISPQPSQTAHFSTETGIRFTLLFVHVFK